MNELTYNYLFGPVPSHRLGRSLGIDPFGGASQKTCTMDCIFCEVGKTRFRSCKPFSGPDPEMLAKAVLESLNDLPRPDFVTVSGSGEPTLWSGLGHLLADLRQSITIPLAVITNSTTLGKKAVREALALADVVLPKLTTTDEGIFRHIHNPLPEITAKSCVEGIRLLRQETSAKIWLEVFLLAVLNDGKDSLFSLAEAIRIIQPHKVQITTLSRPGQVGDLKPVTDEGLQRAKELLSGSGIPVEMVGKCVLDAKTVEITPWHMENLLTMLRLRWVALPDLQDSLGVGAQEMERLLAGLPTSERLIKKEMNGIIFLRIEQKGS